MQEPVKELDILRRKLVALERKLDFQGRGLSLHNWEKRKNLMEGKNIMSKLKEISRCTYMGYNNWKLKPILRRNFIPMCSIFC